MVIPLANTWSTSPSYYGDVAPDAADKIVYRQLKHSTARADQPLRRSPASRRPWRVLRAGSRRLATPAPAQDRVTFEFVSNRPVDDAVIQALNDISRGATPASPQITEYLQAASGCQRT